MKMTHFEHFHKVNFRIRTSGAGIMHFLILTTSDNLIVDVFSNSNVETKLLDNSTNHTEGRLHSFNLDSHSRRQREILTMVNEKGLNHISLTPFKQSIRLVILKSADC